MVYKTDVTDTILWDGPESFEEYERGLFERQEQVKNGELYMFTIIDEETSLVAGTADIRPYDAKSCGDIGLWIGENFHRKGLGTKVVKELTRYAFEVLRLEKIEGFIFVGNEASKKVFENSGYKYIGIVSKKAMKNGKYIDKWKFEIEKE